MSGLSEVLNNLESLCSLKLTPPNKSEGDRATQDDSLMKKLPRQPSLICQEENKRELGNEKFLARFAVYV
jgi:hypothetical protein